ncbi:hypothetical protein QYE76_037115 [Lolium multiflorum]|uniref:CCHC-type domain-containing protein n=1 Tax=Lolium multiflorum TaxID=4521 RepID=A0AAD8VMR0_LOLMU|nr:hypothetical protein QYE76_037115 [Lolium multiflorum]
MKPKNGPKPDAECYSCKEKGHWKRNCSKYLADLSGLVKKKKEDNNDEDPATYEEAMMSPDSNKWQEAMKSEMGSMYDNKVLWKVLEGSRKVRKKPPRKVESTWDSTSIMANPSGEESQVDSPRGPPNPYGRLGHQLLGFHLYNEGPRGGAGHPKTTSWPPPWSGRPPLPNPSAQLLHHSRTLSEARRFSPPPPTPARFVGFKRSYYFRCRRWSGEVDVVFINNRTCDRSTEVRVRGAEPIVIKIFYAFLQAASEHLPQQQDPHLVGFGISSREFGDCFRMGTRRSTTIARVNMEASKRADFVRKIHVKTKELIEKKGKSNPARKKRKEMLFKPGDMVWVSEGDEHRTSEEQHLDMKTDVEMDWLDMEAGHEVSHGRASREEG